LPHLAYLAGGRDESLDRSGAVHWTWPVLHAQPDGVHLRRSWQRRSDRRRAAGRARGGRASGGGGMPGAGDQLSDVTKGDRRPWMARVRALGTKGEMRMGLSAEELDDLIEHFHV